MMPEQYTLDQVQRIIARAPPDEQVRVHAAAQALCEVLAQHGDDGQVALHLVFAELMVRP